MLSCGRIDHNCRLKMTERITSHDVVKVNIATNATQAEKQIRTVNNRLCFMVTLGFSSEYQHASSMGVQEGVWYGF